MKWEIDGELLVVQGCIERARDALDSHAWKSSLAETSASKVYHFESTKLGELGALKISILPEDRTALHATPPGIPRDVWLAANLDRLMHYPPDYVRSPVLGLLRAYHAARHQHGPSGLFPEFLLRGDVTEEEADPFETFGLRGPGRLEAAIDEFHEWGDRVRAMRAGEFNEILGIAEKEIRLAGLQLRQTGLTDPADASSAGSVPPWEAIPRVGSDREIIKMWCENLTGRQIAGRLGYRPNSVTNRIARLRKLYPDAHIPRDEDRRQMIRR